MGARHQPHCAPSCELALRIVGAARGRPGGGASSLGVGRPGLGAPTPDRLSFARGAGARYPLAVGAGGVGMGTHPQHHSARSCDLAVRAVGAARGRLGAGVSCLGVGRPGLGTVQRPTARPWGVRPGPVTHQPVGAGGVGVGIRHLPHNARWLCTLWGWHQGAGGGASLAWVWGVRGWALSHARPPVLGACGSGPLPTGCGCGGVGMGTHPQTPQRALLRAGCPRCGGGTRAPGGGVSCLGVGRPGLGTVPRPTARPWCVRPGPVTHWL